jgi:hypothetical protein
MWKGSFHGAETWKLESWHLYKIYSARGAIHFLCRFRESASGQIIWWNRNEQGERSAHNQIATSQPLQSTVVSTKVFLLLKSAPLTPDIFVCPANNPTRGFTLNNVKDWSNFETTEPTIYYRPRWVNTEDLDVFEGLEGAILRGQPVALRTLIVPYWLLVACSMLLPAIWLFHRSRRKRRRSRKHCPNCNYDLRATPHRCPECGAVPSTSLAPYTSPQV